MNPLAPLTHLLPPSLSTFVTAPASHSTQSVKLARFLELPVAELSSVRLGARYHYRPFFIAKQDGRERRILAPSPALKALQRRLLDHYLATLPAHPSATAFRTGASIVTNARRHVGQTLIVTADLANFFESTTADRVRACFVKNGWRGEALATLMRLCVYRDGLPQGAPTSPCLSNLVNIGLDEALTTLAQRAHAVYTRYGDDLTFSWRAERLPADFQLKVEDCLREAGYAIQPRKGWNVSRSADEPHITGLVLGRGGRLQLPWQTRLRIWQLRWRWWWTRDEQTAAQLQGYEGVVRMIR